MKRTVILCLFSVLASACSCSGDDPPGDGGMGDGAVRPDGATFDGAFADGVSADGTSLDGALLDGAFSDAIAFDAGPPPPTPTRVDVLFVVDNSGSLADEQGLLKGEVPGLVDAIASGRSADGTTFTPITDIHLGVVSTDMGLDGMRLANCEGRGEDGLLRSGIAESCLDISPSDPPYLQYLPGEGEMFSEDAQCLLSLGTNGCGFEQPMHAFLKALTPASSAIRFYGGTTGHGSDGNAGFLREDSLLVIMMLSDEDDCSTADPDLFNPSSTVYTEADINYRCIRYDTPEYNALQPIHRYVSGLLALRHPSRVIFSAIAGIPPELATDPTTGTDYERLVGDEAVRHPAMVPRRSPDMVAASVCDSVTGRAFPAVRMSRLARGLDEVGVPVMLQSICTDEYGTAFNQLGDLIAAHLTE